MTKICGIVAVAGLAAVANAQSARLDLQVSSDGGSTWSDAVNVLPGTNVLVRVQAEVTAAYGFAGAVCRITGSGLAAGDGASINGTDSRVAPFNFGAATQAVFATAGAFRIDAASDAANTNGAGIAILQRDPVTAGAAYADGSQARTVYAFSVSVGADGSIRTIALNMDDFKAGVVSVHTTANSTRGTNITAFTVDGASINVIPTPATLALMGLGGLVAGRRRR
jgi:uncharacterized protein (TIGR03382 family)